MWGRLALIAGVAALIGGGAVVLHQSGEQEDEEGAPPEKHEVCHVPPGNPGKAKTLTLPEPAIAAHLKHGDYEGVCEEAAHSK